MSSRELSDEWKPITDASYRARLFQELRREIENNPRHVLFDRSVEFIAEWNGSREKDFIVRDTGGNYLTVHLTYSVEHDPSWPWTEPIDRHSELRYIINQFAAD